MESTERPSVADYITERGITATTQHVGRAIGENWSKDHHEYAVTLTLPGGASIRTSYKCNPLYHMGNDEIHKAIPRGPVSLGALDLRGMTFQRGGGAMSIAQAEYNKLAKEWAPSKYQADPAEVLDCLLSDADCTDEPFEEWARNYGYDEDSRKAEAIFHACRETAAKLRRWLGAAELERLASEYERL